MKVSRKQFIGYGAMALPSLFFLPAILRKSLATSANKTLIIVQMAGGNDGLNMLIPYSDPLYYKYRPILGIATEKVLALDSDVGLHPNLEKFKGLWDKKMLAIIEGAGYPQPNYSHFESMRIWQTASPDGTFKDGWAGRFIDAAAPGGGDVFRGLAVGARTPPELISDKVAVPTVQSLAAYRFQSDPAFPSAAQGRLDSLASLYSSAPQSLANVALLNATIQLSLESSKQLTSVDQRYKPAATYPSSGLAGALKVMAEAITGETGLRVGQVALGSFDTHVNQEPVQSRLFTELSEAISAFFLDLEGHGRADDVLLMTWSEFGRRVAGNASNGTDHGSAGPLFVIGKSVAGGLYGKRPDLSNLDSGNLRFTTDFRSVYSTILEQWLQTPSAPILGGQFPTLPFLA